jgi:uncharacterized protein YndB with AHSA1/START domain
MNHYRNSLVIKANPAAVYAALTTREGLRGWWTCDCEVAGAVGGAIHVRFARTRKEFRIERLGPGREVRWTCVAAHIAADKVGPRVLAVDVPARSVAFSSATPKLAVRRPSLRNPSRVA